MSSIRDDGVAVPVVMGRRYNRGGVGKDGVASLNSVCCGREVREGDLSKIGSKDKCVVAGGREDVIVAGDLYPDFGASARHRRLARPGLSIQNASTIAVVGEHEIVLRIISQEL